MAGLLLTIASGNVSNHGTFLFQETINPFFLYTSGIQKTIIYNDNRIRSKSWKNILTQHTISTVIIQ